jgi:hypothetical protein
MTPSFVTPTVLSVLVIPPDAEPPEIPELLSSVPTTPVTAFTG